MNNDRLIEMVTFDGQTLADVGLEHRPYLTC